MSTPPAGPRHEPPAGPAETAPAGTEATEILVAEHDPAVAELIRRYLVKEGLRVRSVRTPEQTTAALAGCRAAAIVLDLTMPGLDAREIRRLIRGRQATADGQVICLTAGEAPHPAAGLRPRDIGVGQEACVQRPFGPRTLVTRVRAAAKAAAAAGTQGRPCAAGRLRVEPGGRRATLDGAPLALTGTEFDLLTCLVRSAGRAIRREALRHAVWGPGGAAGDRIVDVYIAQLRAKLGPGHGIRTVRGIGYVLDTRGAAPSPLTTAPRFQPGAHNNRQKAPATIGCAGHPIRGDSGTA